MKKLVGTKLVFLALPTIILLTASVNAESGLYDRGQDYYYGHGVEQSYPKALSAFEHALKLHDLDAQTALGIMYIQGHGVKQNDKKGIDYLKKSAKLGHAKGQYVLGSMYYLGIGVERDLKLAHQWIKKSANQGYADAQYNLALMYEQGNGVKNNPLLANKWRIEAAKSGNSDEQYRLGVAYEEDEDYKQAYEWLIKSANQDHAKAQEKLAELLDQGVYLYRFGTHESDRRSADWYQKSYDNGNLSLSYKLASIYDSESIRDYKKAHKLYQQSITQGNLAAYLDIARHYELGQGVAINLAKSYSFTIAAARKGYQHAWRGVADLYLQGKGVKKSIKKAKYWLKKLSKSGDLKAKEQLESL